MTHKQYVSKDTDWIISLHCWDVLLIYSFLTWFALLFNTDAEKTLLGMIDQKILQSVGNTEMYNFCLFMCVPLYGDSLGEAVVGEEDSDAGQLVHRAGFYSIHTFILHHFNHIGPAPPFLFPLNKDHGA